MTKTALIGIMLALAACSKAQPAPGAAGDTKPAAPAPAPAPAPPAPTPAPAAPTPASPAPTPAPAAAGDTKPAPKKGPPMSPADESVITKHYEKQGWGKPLEIITYERVPGMYKAEFSDGAGYGVIRGGKLLEGKGLAAAGAYMKDAKLLALQPDVPDLILLLTIFEALPPVSDYAAPDQFYEHATKLTQLNPKAELGPGGGKLVLHYLVRHKGGPVAQPTILTVKRWTLTIPPDYKLAWREEETKVDTKGP